ncbi:hypothetical protein XFLM_07515 [Xylella fastidiosa subsp. fastidiosa GB514]|jgi:hypothetical protein|nr:hypothetical protein [Xylella fastidiosa]ADN63415.1 hypothetical protein XFLM_07515 [Xylella fastidiosa subsp. fastidiosa GB514]EGO81458.1 hypothetical protein XFEB_01649 [Xylella fastidiosa EB92.1]KGM21212.1 hypothetical protein JT24_02320 [Xylella fastidiosa]
MKSVMVGRCIRVTLSVISISDRDRPGVVIIVEAESADAARKSLSKFPLAEAGLIGWDVIPLGPFVNLEALFASGNA